MVARLRAAFFRSSEFETLGHGKKIHCFSGKTLEAGRRFFFINSVGIPRKPQTGMLKCWSCSLVPGLPPQLPSLAVRITGRSVIRTASDDTCGGGLGTRLQVMHEGSHICRFANAKLVTFELI